MARVRRRRWRASLMLLLMVVSGFAGLGYQIVWTQQLALSLGHESAAVLAVVTAFFGGLALGALAFGSSIERTLRPERWYAACELVVALWGLLLIRAMPVFSLSMLRLTGVEPTPAWQWSMAFGGTFVLLLPATAAMGATLPAMERIIARIPEHWRGDATPGRAPHRHDRSIAALYAGNTFGAVIGALVTAFWLVPGLGLAATAVSCVILNLLCSLTALAFFPARVEPTTRAHDVADSAFAPSPPDRARAHSAVCRLALTGLLGIGYEVVVVRVLCEVTENTVYTFAMLLAVYLVGSAAGAAGHQLLRARLGPDERDDWLLVALATACLIGTATLWTAEQSKALALQLLGGSSATACASILAEAVPALLAFGPATVVMGALFTHLSRRAHSSGISFGRALGVNTLGAAAAPALFGVLVFPAFGSKLTLLLIDVGYLALISRRSWLRPVVWVPAGAALAMALVLALLAPPLAFIEVPAGGRVVSYEEGVMAAVSVVEDADGVARLRINNRQQEGSSASERVDGRQAWLPLLLHPAPRRALFLGLGTGITASSAAEDPSLQVDAVELLPEVIAASAHFARAVADGAASSRLHVRSADARRYVRASERSYDVIVSDNFHPARSGSGALYTIEHFAAVRLRLEPGGVFCQWLPLHQLDLQTLRSIVQSFLAVYPQGWAMLASNSLETPVLGLVGRRDALRFDAAVIRERLARGASPERMAALGLEDELAVLGSFVAGPQALRRFAASAAANTDDHPLVAYRAPRITYAPDSTPGDRLIALLRELTGKTGKTDEPGQLILPTVDPAWPARLAAYWVARDRFIESGRDVRPSPRVQEMLVQVREPLLAVLRLSPDFRPAYDPLLLMATALARSDVSGARTLLGELRRLQPVRAEAGRALQLIATPAPATSPLGR